MERLDKELVIRGLVETRVKAQELIKNNLVLVNKKITAKSSVQIKDTDQIEIVDNERFKYVSRGGFKLEKALQVFGYDMTGKSVMDIGSSTGGFTDCCLQSGASALTCIDVGTDVMDKKLRNDSRVKLFENTNFKDIDKSLFENIDIAVADVSFISLAKIFEKIYSCGVVIDAICLIKPQFECGREIASKYSGVISNKNIHIDIINQLLEKLNSFGFVCLGLDFSPIKGGDGNIEYLGFFTNKSNKVNNINVLDIVAKAFENLK